MPTPELDKDAAASEWAEKNLPTFLRIARSPKNMMEAMVAKAVGEKAPQIASEIGQQATQTMVPPALIGAGTGALGGAIGGAGHDDARTGAGRGALVGALGGLAGRYTGAGYMRPAIGGLAAGIPAGYLFGKKEFEKQDKPKMKKKAEAIMKSKYAGVTLDWYDDKGEFLKERFPTVESLPQMIKHADIRPKEKLDNEDFALIAVDEGIVMRKFACHDAGTTTMSVIYFLEHGNKLPEEAQKVAAARLTNACQYFGLKTPMELVKISLIEPREKQSAVVDITGKSSNPITKVAKPMTDNDYAVVFQDGRKFYPINTWDRVKLAEQYYADEGIRMDPEIRHQFVTKLSAKAEQIGYPLNGKLKEAGSQRYASQGHMRAAIEMRKVACAPGQAREALEELFEKRAELKPQTYAEVLRRLDVSTGLDKGWDTVILDPWSSTFGVDKTATIVWEQAGERVSDGQLRTLARNSLDSVKQAFGFGFADEFVKDPVGMFKSMPDPEKKVLARMAFDSANQGGSEFEDAQV